MKQRPCQKCGATIFFALTSNARPTPLDAHISTVYSLDDEGVVTGETRGHQSHWATCPHAKDFKQAGRNSK